MQAATKYERTSERTNEQQRKPRKQEKDQGFRFAGLPRTVNPVIPVYGTRYIVLYIVDRRLSFEYFHWKGIKKAKEMEQRIESPGIEVVIELKTFLFVLKFGYLKFLRVCYGTRHSPSFHIFCTLCQQSNQRVADHHDVKGPT
jgi:hypothetical protein